MLPCGSSCGEINVISYQPFSIMPCMHLESCGDLNFKLSHIIYESQPRPVHRQSQWVVLGDYVRALNSITTIPQNNFSHILRIVLPQSLICPFVEFFWVKLLKVLPSLKPEIPLKLWHIRLGHIMTILGSKDIATSETKTLPSWSLHSIKK